RAISSALVVLATTCGIAPSLPGTPVFSPIGTTGTETRGGADPNAALVRVAVWGTTADRLSAGWMMNWPDGLYRIMKSISASWSPFGSHRLTRRRLTCSPRVVEIRRLVCAGFGVIGLPKNSCGFRSECCDDNDSI